jgi:hypothetical protein
MRNPTFDHSDIRIRRSWKRAQRRHQWQAFFRRLLISVAGLL